MKSISQNITIVIPCKNEERYICNTLLSIASQVGIAETRIIIADAKSIDTTRLKIEEFKKDFHNINIEVIDGGLPGLGRNLGAGITSTPYILFLDADANLSDDSVIERCNIYLNRLHPPLLISSTPKYNGQNIISNILFGINNFVMNIMAKFEPFAIGGFFLVKIDKFNELGGFDTKCCNAEDWRLSRKFNSKEFILLEEQFYQDDRRFKQFGYIQMIKLMFTNWLNRNNDEYFRQDVGYFKK